MKKSLLAVILAVALVAPVFAAKGDKSINAKVGLGVSNNLNMKVDDTTMGYEMKMPISIGAEFFYGLMDNLSVGIGINYGFDSDLKANISYIGSSRLTSYYVAVKPEAKLDSKIFSSMYLIGQIGGSNVNIKSSNGSYSAEGDMGIYLGFGAGTIIKDAFIVEFIVSSANSKISVDGVNGDLNYTATTLNVVYKFAI